MGRSRLPPEAREALTAFLIFPKMTAVKTEKLEALSLDELYALADRAGLDLPPGLERPFVIEEIAEALEEDEEETEDRRASQGEALHIDEKKYSDLRIDDIEPAPLPAEEGAMALRYNETMIRAIARDPSWAFAFWDVADAELAALRGDESSAGLFLRVAEIGAEDEQPGPEGHREYFDIPVSDGDLQWYINLPRSGVRFRIDLCARKPGFGKLRVLARSNEVESPRQSFSLPQSGLDKAAFELLALSGIEDLPLDELPDGNPLRILHSGHGESADRAD
jgi:uncharacterized protein